MTPEIVYRPPLKDQYSASRRRGEVFFLQLKGQRFSGGSFFRDLHRFRSALLPVT